MCASPAATSTASPGRPLAASGSTHSAESSAPETCSSTRPQVKTSPFAAMATVCPLPQATLVSRTPLSADTNTGLNNSSPASNDTPPARGSPMAQAWPLLSSSIRWRRPQATDTILAAVSGRVKPGPGASRPLGGHQGDGAPALARPARTTGLRKKSIVGASWAAMRSRRCSCRSRGRRTAAVRRQSTACTLQSRCAAIRCVAAQSVAQLTASATRSLALQARQLRASRSSGNEMSRGSQAQLKGALLRRPSPRSQRKP
mmetsp:Transcript_12255/g.38393  ORF Transcript_12255/g.38393 Transcript_12255/m.38393 type:complete len:259 (+) Transcript_12255:209-985(+)